MKYVRWGGKLEDLKVALIISMGQKNVKNEKVVNDIIRE
jgi:hypothetical protein